MLQPEDTPESQLEYFSTKFDATEFKIDLYVLFTEKIIALNREEGGYGVILPNTFISNTYTSKLRDLLLHGTNIRSIAVSDDYLFDDAVVHNAILIGGIDSDSTNKEVEVIWKVDKEFLLNEYPVSNATTRTIPINKLDYTNDGTWDIRLSDELIPVFDSIRSEQISVKDISDVNRGLVTGDSDKYLFETPQNENYHPLLSGGDIDRYTMNTPETYVKLDKPDEGAVVGMKIYNLQRTKFSSGRSAATQQGLWIRKDIVLASIYFLSY